VPTPSSIIVVSGVGSGCTELSAFDAALRSVGIPDFNLIRLSSIIPPGSRITAQRAVPLRLNAEVGDRLYVVLSSLTERRIGHAAWAGLGWVQSEDGRGLFVEQTGPSEDEVRQLIRDGLLEMADARGYPVDGLEFRTQGVSCEEQPVCALVAAVYASEPW